MTRERFKRLVDEALETIPENFRDAMQNIAIVIEDEPTPEQLDDVGIDPSDTLPVSTRHSAHRAAMGARQHAARQDHALPGPDRRRERRRRCRRGHWRDVDPRDRALLRAVREEIEAIEEQYWRGEGESEPTDREVTRSGRPRKRFGQHFLAPGWARQVVAAVDPAPGDVFLEIGPSRGALTLPLADSGAPILAVEIDRDLVADLLKHAHGT